MRTARAGLRPAAALALASLAMMASGCGRKAPPVPPVIQKPERVRDLSVLQEGSEAILTWGYPAMTTAGTTLPPLESVEVWRLTLPASQEPAGFSPQDLAVRRQLMESRGKRLVRLEGDAIDDATRGSSMELRDDLGSWHEEESETGDVVWYSVLSICCDGRASEMSNISRLVPQLPPSPPEDLRAEASADGVVVRWTAVSERGTLVERSADGEVWQRLTTEPVTGGEWLDGQAEQGHTWHYRLRASEVVAGGARVVGEPGDAISVAYPDIYPAPSPANLICLPEGGLVRLRWDGVGEEVTFVVSRQPAGEDAEDVARVEGATSYEDRAPRPGGWIYGVRSVDGAGNESQPATCETVVGDGA